MGKQPALLIVDLQNDFCPGGALGIPGGDKVVEPLNRAAALFAACGLPVVATRDWHPLVSSHFREFGGSWPVHCVKETEGAAFHPGLRLSGHTVVVSKGGDPDSDGYSAFEGVTDDGLLLQDVLHALGVQTLYIGGLATDFCVLFTTREALASGFDVVVLKDAVAGVDIVPGSSASALEEMSSAGAVLLTVEELERTGIPVATGGSHNGKQCL